jgi:hypothetical protein
VNAVAASSPYAQGELICFHARHIWQIWREPEVASQVASRLPSQHHAQYRNSFRYFVPLGTRQKYRHCSAKSTRCHSLPKSALQWALRTPPSSTTATAAAGPPTATSSTRSD